MQPGQTNETRAAVWKRCRVIGVINTVLVILMLVITIVALVELIAHPKDYFNDAETKYGHKLPNIYLTYALIGCSICVYFGLLYFNYGILRGSTPNDGVVIKEWLLVHKIIFGLCFILLIVEIITNYKHITEIAIRGVTVIVLLVEIIVVHKFYKELTTSGIENPPASV